jgi:hypothetical protein
MNLNFYRGIATRIENFTTMYVRDYRHWDRFLSNM